MHTLPALLLGLLALLVLGYLYQRSQHLKAINALGGIRSPSQFGRCTVCPDWNNPGSFTYRWEEGGSAFPGEVPCPGGGAGVTTRQMCCGSSGLRCTGKPVP